jgi:hypothetical protein
MGWRILTSLVSTVLPVPAKVLCLETCIFLWRLQDLGTYSSYEKSPKPARTILQDMTG